MLECIDTVGGLDCTNSVLGLIDVQLSLFLMNIKLRARPSAGLTDICKLQSNCEAINNQKHLFF